MTSKEALEKVLFAYYGDDILIIKLFLAKKGVYIDESWAIQELWEDFSDEVYCAGWLTVQEDFLQEFYEWLYKEVNGIEL